MNGEPLSLSWEGEGSGSSSVYMRDDAINPSSSPLPNRESIPLQIMTVQDSGLADALGLLGSLSSPSHHSTGSLVTAAAVAASWHPDDTRTWDLSGPLDVGPNHGASTTTHPVLATDDISGLRAEVQDLRRAMEQMREEHFELPPMYQE